MRVVDSKFLLARTATLVAILSFAGCAPTLEHVIVATAIINTVGPDSDEPADSRPIAFRLYPLNSCPEPDAFKWEEFRTVEYPDSVKEIRAGSLKEYIIKHHEQQGPFTLSYSRDVRCVLAVTVGRFEGEKSVQVLKLKRRVNELTFKLNRYDIYVFDGLQAALSNEEDPP